MRTPESRLRWIARICKVATAPWVRYQHVWPAGRPLPRMNPFRRRRLVVVNVADEPLWLHGEDHSANAEAVMAEIRRLMADGEALLPPGPPVPPALPG